jgi:hypothetical protein
MCCPINPEPPVIPKVDIKSILFEAKAIPLLRLLKYNIIDTVNRMYNTRRDSTLLSLLAGAFSFPLVLWMNSRFTVLYDYSYVVNTSWRWQQGQLPYIDQVVALPPGTFAVVAVFFNLLGTNSTVFAVIGALNGALSSFFLSEIYYKTRPSPYNSGTDIPRVVLLAGVFGVLNSQIVLYFPFYDCFAATGVLFLVYKIMGLKTQPGNFALFGVGIAATVPLFFKLNVGVFSITGATLWLIIEVLLRRKNKADFVFRSALSFLSGLLFLPVMFTAWLASESAIESFYSYVISSPASTKKIVSINQFFYNYSSSSTIILIVAVVLMVVRLDPNKRIAILYCIAYGMLSVPLFIGVITVILPNAWNPLNLIPEFAPTWIDVWPVSVLLGPLFLLIGVRNISKCERSVVVALLLSLSLVGFHMSQGYEGSSYATAPLVLAIFILLTQTLKQNLMPKFLKGATRLVIGVFPILFASWMLYYGMSGNRLASADILPIHQNQRIEVGPNRFIALSPDDAEAYRKLVIELRRYEGKQIAQFPMEDPMPFLVGDHIPWGVCAQADNNTCPRLDVLSTQLVHSNPEIVVVKLNTQLANPTLESWSQMALQLVGDCYAPVTFIGATYVIWESRIGTSDCLLALSN